MDDNSPDGTGVIADRLAEELAEVRVLHRPQKQGLGRLLLSRGGSWYARRLLGIPIRDLTGGFKCFRREVLERLDLEGIDAYGYGFQIELTYRAVQAGFTVAEVPIMFRERRVGRSKMTARIAIEAVWKVPALRLRR